MTPFVLIVVTYLGGSVVLEMITEINKTNIVGGIARFREIVKAECMPK